MVEAILDLFQVHREMIFGDAPIIVQDMLGKTPEALNAVDMVLAAVGQGFGVVQAVVLAPALQGVVAAEGVGVVDRALPGVLSDVGHEFIGSNPLHHLGVHPAVALQKAENNALSGRTPPALALPPAAEVGLVNLDLAFQLAGLQLGHVVHCLAQALVDAGNRLIVQAEVARHAVGRLLLVEAGKDGNLFAQLLQRLLFPAGLVAAAHIAATGPVDLERTAKDTLPASQKVGRTVENVLSSSNHEGILALDGYESH